MKAKIGYVDGFVLPIPRKKLGLYKKIAKLAGKVWKEHGALDYVECIADDVKRGKVTSFPDPRLADLMNPDAMPFDGMRMFWGGFKPFVQIK